MSAGKQAIRETFLAVFPVTANAHRKARIMNSFERVPAQECRNHTIANIILDGGRSGEYRAERGLGSCTTALIAFGITAALAVYSRRHLR